MEDSSIQSASLVVLDRLEKCSMIEHAYLQDKQTTKPATVTV